MGREIRRVPANWEHPKTERRNYATGRMEERYQPLFDEPYSKAITEWIENHTLWEAGKHPDQLDGSGKGYRFYAQWAGGPPDVKFHRPEWKDGEATWFQVYETVSEGTPVSPPFATREELVEYLVASGDFWDQQRGDPPWNRIVADKFVMGDGWAPSMVYSPQHGLQTGVQALGNESIRKDGDHR